MRSPPPPPLNPHRRLHLIGWTLATIFLLAAACLGAAGVEDRLFRRQRDKSLKQIARQIALLIFLRAAELIGRHRYDRTQDEFGRKPRRQQTLRAIVGVALRRALRHRDALKRIGLFLKTLAHIDAHARRLQRRLRNGLTRAWGAAPTPQTAEALPIPYASALAIADTS